MMCLTSLKNIKFSMARFSASTLRLASLSWYYCSSLRRFSFYSCSNFYLSNSLRSRSSLISCSRKSLSCSLFSISSCSSCSRLAIAFLRSSSCAFKDSSNLRRSSVICCLISSLSFSADYLAGEVCSRFSPDSSSTLDVALSSLKSNFLTGSVPGSTGSLVSSFVGET